MDPLSVTASIVTLITVAGSILRSLEHLRTRLDPSSELLAIMNTVTDLQATLIVVRHENDALKKSRIPAARLAYETLPATIERLQKLLNELVDFAHAKLLKSGKGLSRFGMSERKRKQLVDIRDNISDAHRNLQLVLLCANLRRNQELMSTVEDAVIMQNENHNRTLAALDRITTQLTTIDRRGGDDSDGSQRTQNGIRSVLAQTIREDGDGTSTQLRITTIMPLKACDGTCNCQCHVRTQYKTPRWLAAVVGTLFYSSTTTPSLDVRPCNITTCFRSRPSSSTRLTYYFPSWMMRTALAYSSWNNLEGTNSSWTVKMPREIPSDWLCWHYIDRGYVEKVRGLLQSREMSPYDIAPDGVSVLHWAEFNCQLEICSLLMAMGADWHFKNRSGMSPSDFAWRKILLFGSSNPSMIKLRALVSSEDSYDLRLGPLHRIIVGLSSVDFQMQMDLEPSRINDRDWLEYTPLMWAALRNDHTYLSLLLSHGAQTDLTDSEGRAALHHAARVGSLNCVRALLNAGADPNVADNEGLVPLHDVAYVKHNPEAKDIVTWLHDYGADLEAKEDNGWTPLYTAADVGSYEAVAALVECGADVNTLDFYGTPPIYRAIFRGNEEVIQYLCQCGIESSWTPKDHEIWNVLDEAALYGTVKVMNILENSAIPPVECDVAKLKYWFDTYRNVVYGTRCSAEEELAAFHSLLDKKAIPLKNAAGLDSPVAIEDVPDDKIGDDHEQEDLFEDAVEDLSFLDETGTLAAPALVVTS